jgi:hypothetical protein
MREMTTDHTDKSRLLRDMLRRPRKISTVETQSTELYISATNAYAVDALCAELGIGGLAAELEFSFLAVVCALGTGWGSLVSRRTRDT